MLGVLARVPVRPIVCGLAFSEAEDHLRVCCHTADCGLCHLPDIQYIYFSSESFVLLVLQNPLLQRFLLAGSLQLQAGRLHQLQHLRFHIQGLLIFFTASYFQGMDLVFFMQK